MAERVLSLKFPAGGQHLGVGIQSKPPFYTERSLNVRPFDALDERLRGGSRPGLSKYSFWGRGRPQPVGTGAVNLLASINVAGGDIRTPSRFTDDFTDGADPLWVSQGLQAQQGLGMLRLPNFRAGEAKRPRPGNLDVTGSYSIRLLIVSQLWEGTNQRVIDGIVRVGVGLQAPGDTRDFQHFQVELKAEFLPEQPLGQDVTLSLLTFRGTEEMSRQELYRAGQGQGRFLPWIILRVEVVPGTPPTAMVSLEDVQAPFAFASDPIAIPPVLGTHLSVTLVEGFLRMLDNPVLDWYSLKYFVLDAAVFPEPGDLLVAASGGKLRMRRADGDLSSPSGRLHQRNKPLMATDAIGGGRVDIGEGGRAPGIGLFIADYGLDDADEQVAPKYYDPRTNELYDWVVDNYDPEVDDDQTGPKGEEGVPRGNFIAARFKGRIYLAGEPAHAWYASRLGDPFDWDFGQNVFQGGDDPAAAIAGQVAEMSDISEPLRALAPFSDDYMIFATANSMRRLAGDPGFGGRPLLISSEVGIAGPFAWCMTPESELISLDGQRGLFRLRPGGQSFPEPLSANVLPKELRDIDSTDVVASLAYDHRQPGVHIMLTSASGRVLTHWWYDRRLGSFWPLELAKQEFVPLTLMSYQNVNPDLSGVLLGGQDGFIRRFDRPEPEDDGIPFATELLYGPFRLSGRDHIEGVLRWVRGHVVTTQVPPRFEVMTGTTAVGALNGQGGHRRFKTGNFTDKPMEQKPVGLRGVVGYLNVVGQRSPWAMETLDAAVEPIAVPRA